MPYIDLHHLANRRKLNLFRPLLAVFLVLCLLTLGGFFLKGKNSGNNKVEPEKAEVLSSESRVGAPVNSLGILILGYGGAGHPGGFLTDAIQVLYLDYDSQKASLISIPRDLYVKFPDGRENKINSAAVNFSKNSKNVILGGASEMKNFVGNLLGVKIDYFVGVDFVGFQRAVGLNLKSLDVEVSEPLFDPWYPITGKELEPCDLTPEEIAEISNKYSGFELEKQFPCRYEKLDFKTGSQKMTAGDALKYVRSRHGSGQGDLSRNIRQQEVLTAVKNKIISLGFIDDIPGFFSDINKQVQTDLDIDSLKQAAPLAKNASGFKLEYINLGEKNVLTTGNAGGAAIVRPKEGLHKWDKLREYVKSELAS